MTIICAMRENGDTWIASDTQTSDGWDHINDCGFKFVTTRDSAVGISGDLRTASIVEHHANELVQDVEGPIDFGQKLVPVLERFKHGLNVGEGSFPNLRSSFILVSQNNVWMVACDLSFHRVQDGELAAYGSGMSYAYGVAFGLAGSLPADEILTRCCEAAIKYDTHCGGEIIVRKL